MPSLPPEISLIIQVRDITDVAAQVPAIHVLITAMQSHLDDCHAGLTSDDVVVEAMRQFWIDLGDQFRPDP